MHFFIHPESKRAIISGITANPNSAWVTQQARNVTMEIADLGFATPEVHLIDHDSKYTKEFDAVWSAREPESNGSGRLRPISMPLPSDLHKRCGSSAWITS